MTIGLCCVSTTLAGDLELAIADDGVPMSKGRCGECNGDFKVQLWEGNVHHALPAAVDVPQPDLNALSDERLNRRKLDIAGCSLTCVYEREVVSNADDRATEECDPAPADSCPSDLDGNGFVNIYDLLVLLGEYGLSCEVDGLGESSCMADLDQNGAVEAADLLILLSDVGGQCDCLDFSITAGPAPLQLGCPVDNWLTEIESWLSIGGGASIQSNCGALSWTHDFDVLGFSCQDQIFTHEVNFVVSDGCGCSLSFSSTIETTGSALCQFSCYFSDEYEFSFCDMGSFAFEPTPGTLDIVDHCGNPLDVYLDEPLWLDIYPTSLGCDGYFTWAGEAYSYPQIFVAGTSQSIELSCYMSGVGFTSPVAGCTDPEASNYHASAYEPDGSCVYSTAECAPVAYQGYTYDVVEIGTQCWFSENLRSSNYTNGEAIEEIEDSFIWNTTNEGAQCTLNNDPENVFIYGRLYNGWSVLDERGLCPSGWHVPTDADWMTLESELGMMEWSGLCGLGYRGVSVAQAMKASPDDEPGWNGTNSSGLSSLPGEARGQYGFESDIACAFWSQSEVDFSPSCGLWSRRLINFSPSGVGREVRDLNVGMSVRCIQD